MNIPVRDYTARGLSRAAETGGRGVGLGPIDPYNNEYVWANQQANTQALYDALGLILPVHPALGSNLQELGRKVMDAAVGQGTTVGKNRKWLEGSNTPSALDRIGGLIGTWTGRAGDDIGSALGLSPEDLAKVSRALASLNNDPEAQSEFLKSLGQGIKARYGGKDGPLAFAEDFGPAPLGIAASSKRISDAARKALRNIKLEKQAGVPDVKGTEFRQAFDELAESEPLKGLESVDWEPKDDEFYKWLEADSKVDPNDPGLTSEGVNLYKEGLEKKGKGEPTPSKPSDPKFVPLYDDEIAALSDDALDIEINRTNTTINKMTKSGPHKAGKDIGSGLMDEDHEGYLLDFKEELEKLVAERNRRKGASSFDVLDANFLTIQEIKDAIDAGDIFSDSDIDKAIQDINKKLNADPPTDADFFDKDWLDDALDLFVSERHKRKRRKDKGGGGSAGAQKTQSKLQQMMQIEGKVQPDIKDITPVGGMHHEFFNKKAFDKDADLGNIDLLLSQGKFISKRNTWHFPVDADPAVFNLDAFVNRMSQHQHKASSDDIIILMDILERAKGLPSKRKLSSMAEDLYTMLSGPTKNLVVSEYGGSSPLGFDF
jgi:hypothetical protein